MESAIKTNSPPVISSAKILPDEPNVESGLNVFVQSKNPGQNPVTYHYQWIKNGEEMTGANTHAMGKGEFRKGELIQVKITPSNAKTDGTPFLSAAVKIVNSPPAIQEVWIEPKVAYATDGLKANVKSSDPDGDSINYTYSWENNGVALSEEKTEILDRSRFKKGDSIAVTVIPDDGETSGSPQKSQPIIIANSPPVITSSPPERMNGNIYTYQVKAIDADNDAVRFGLKTAPKGMDIDKETGFIRWEIRKGSHGKHPIEIEASDGEGAKGIQRYTFSVEFR